MQNAFKVGIFLALSALSVARAQNSDGVIQGPSTAQPTSQAAPIVRGYPGGNHARGVQTFDSQPAAGLFVRSDSNNGVQTVASSGNNTEFRVVQGKANVTVHHPENGSRILVDLPGGQVSLLKDGLYTFNAETNTVRVLHGEAEARNPIDNTKGTKVRETQQLAFFGNAKLRAVNAYPYELTADLMPGAGGNHGDGVGEASFYGGYPIYAGGYGYPYGFYPYGYGYPYGLGIGFGYGGGFGYRGGLGYGGGFGGFRGGSRGGFRR